MVPETPFYRAASGELSQGDIFGRVPLVYANADPLPLQSVSIEGRTLLEASPISEIAQPAEMTHDLQVAATCDFTRAVLLTYDCEIDKPATKYLTLALVRPLDPSMPKQSQQIIRENRKLSMFFLPSEGHLRDSLVDFIRVSTLPKDLLRSAEDRLPFRGGPASHAVPIHSLSLSQRLDGSILSAVCMTIVTLPPEVPTGPAELAVDSSVYQATHAVKSNEINRQRPRTPS